MKYFFIVGEFSGDIHAARVVKELKKEDSSIEIYGWGGSRMKEAGANILRDYNEYSLMGFLEVLMNLRKIFRTIKECKKDISKIKPDAIILVDFPGFNLRIASWAKKNGIKALYYISPKIWAWKEGRIKRIKRDIHRMFVILPFEKEFYSKLGFEVDYVGNPLIKTINEEKETELDEFYEKYNIDKNKKIISILPGSRKQEIKFILPEMASVIEQFPDFQFIIGKVENIEAKRYIDIVGENVKLIENETYKLVRASYISIVTSGTATLETALLNTPQVVCYKGGAISFFIAKSFVKIKYISLVNLILDKELVTELIQTDLNKPNLTKEIEKLTNESYRNEIFEGYQNLNSKMSNKNCSKIVAKLIINNS